MVVQSFLSGQTAENQEAQSTSFKWTAVAVQEAIEKGYRLEASTYGVEGRHAREYLKRCKWDVVRLGEGFIEDAFYLDRFKRVYIEERDGGIPLLLPSQITNIYPKGGKFISPKTDIDIESTRVKYGQVLLTRSGTVGVVSYVSRTLETQVLSDDVIRIEINEYPGYVYTFLKSKIGRLLVNINNYGAVVEHIEPEHLNHIPIPDPPSLLKQTIHNLIEESFELRDDSNDLMDEAQTLLQGALNLPPIKKLQAQVKQIDQKADMLNFSVPASELNNRLDGSYHVPIVRNIERHLEKTAKEIVKVGDTRISQSVILPGRFKRIYVEESRGVVFFGGKQIYELDPNNKKHLSLSHHRGRIKNQLTLREKMTIITRSGTIGRVTIVPKHWEDWIANEHIIRVVPANDEIAGYLYAWLSSDYAYPFITRYTYGAVVDEIDDKHVSAIAIPLLGDEKIQQMTNDKVLEANKKRTEAYELEQEALTVLNEQVICAKPTPSSSTPYWKG